MKFEQSKDCFKKLGISYQKFEKITGIPSSTAHNFFIGKTNPQLSTYEKIKKAYKKVLKAKS